MNDDCFVIEDHNGHALSYVYFEDEPGRRAAAKLLVGLALLLLAEGVRLKPANVAQLAELLKRPLAQFRYLLHG